MTDFLTAKKWLIELLKFPTVEQPPIDNMPFGKPLHDCLNFALDLMEQNGFSVANIDGYCGYGEIGHGDMFGILCHLDVVPASGDWRFPPFSATEYNNRIYARGALDNKSPFIGCLFAVIKLLEQGYKPTKRIRFILGCDEESGWTCMDRYQKTEEMPKMGISPDGDFPVINCEKGIVYHKITLDIPPQVIAIAGGERANMVPDFAQCTLHYNKDAIAALQSKNCKYQLNNDKIIVTTKGISAHGSHPEDGKNALIALFDALDFIPEFAQLSHSFGKSNGQNIALDLCDKESGNLTLNLGLCYLKDNSIVLELDIRHPISFDKNSITEILQQQLPFTVEQGFFHLPLYVSKDHPLVKTLLNAYNTVMKTDLQPITIGGGTYARVLPLGVAFGPCFPDSEANIHCVDEYVDLDEWQKSIDIYYLALKELCFMP